MDTICRGKNIRARKIRFYEDNGRLPMKGVGTEVKGDFHLIQDPQSGNMLISSDAVALGDLLFFPLVVLKGERKGSFSFTKEALREGKKKIKFQIQMVGNIAPIYNLIGYNFETHTGVCYLFDGPNTFKKWMQALHHEHAEMLDDDGMVVSMWNVHELDGMNDEASQFEKIVTCFKKACDREIKIY